MRKKLRILLRGAKHHCDILSGVLRQYLLLLELEGQGLPHLYTTFPRYATVETVDRKFDEDMHGLHVDILASCLGIDLKRKLHTAWMSRFQVDLAWDQGLS